MNHNTDERTITLKFDRSLAGLAGNPFGKKIYNEQVKGKIAIGADVRIVFPNQILRIASSFIQGFFNEWLEAVGVEGIKRHIKVQTSSEELTKKVYDNLV